MVNSIIFNTPYCLGMSRRLRFRSRGKIPSGPGIYLFKNNRNGMILYVGETATLRARTNRHRAEGRPFAKRNTTIFWIPLDNRSTSTSRRKIETRLIKQHKPKFNRNSGGGGRIARRRIRHG